MNIHATELTTRSGFAFHIRPASPADDRTLADFFTHVTRADLRFRFLSALNVVGESQIESLTHIDHRQTENYLAFTPDGSTMIATAMLACDTAMDRGEVAIAIHAGFKEKGVGWEMLAYVAHHAATLGLQTLESIESRDNHAAIELERNMGFTATSYPDDPTLVLVSRALDPGNMPELASAGRRG
jgi:N-acetylglutamate synthase-like GNAT family acetyltransferase